MRTHTRSLAIPLAMLLAACGGGSSGPPSSQAPGEAPEPPGDPACTEFDSTFAAIQEVIFERQGCTQDVCHGSARSGELDLRAESAYANLIDIPSAGSRRARILPKEPLKSYLFLKLAAATDPSLLGDEVISGTPMPVGTPLTAGQLEALRIWIEAGAPQTGAVGDNVGRGSAGLAELLGACLPEAGPVEVAPLPVPDASEGVQLVMPPHRIQAGGEVEICYASYFDFRGQIPERFLDETGDFYFANREERREDPNTHHLIVMKPTVPIELIHDESFGGWWCASGEREGAPCDPLDAGSCGDGLCRSGITAGPTCIGFGPSEGRPNGGINFDETYLIPEIKVDGFYTRLPTHGLVYWNSHAFNLTSKDAVHHAYRNYYFTDDLQVEMSHFNDFSQISIAHGTPPFTKATYCNTHQFQQGDQLLYVASHTHKRGEFFWVNDPAGQRIYESPFYDDPVFLPFDPPMQFDSSDPAQRRLTYCAVYNNGVADDGSPDPVTVTRLSKKPERSTCKPVACAEGRIGEPCDGATDHATCDTSPGAGDGMCDACAITGGVTTDDEMFVLLGGVAVGTAP